MAQQRKKAAIHRLKAYNAFCTGTGLSIDELVLSPAEVEARASSAWFWLVNLNLNLGSGMVGVAESAEAALEGIDDVVEIVEWLGKPYALVHVASDAKMVLSKLREPGRASAGRAVLYVELARPATVAALVGALDETTEPINVKDETYGEHKRWDNGLIMIEDFVSKTEERNIMEGILSEAGWHSDLTKRQSRHAGPVFEYTSFESSTSDSRPIPTYLSPFLPRLPRLPDEPMSDQLTVQYYPPGTGIPRAPVPAFGESLYSLSLNSAVSMTLVKCGPDQARRLRLPKRSLASTSSAIASPPAAPLFTASPSPPTATLIISLPPRSLLIMTSAARYGWTHAIAPRRADQIGHRVVPRDPKGRYSVTFRSVRRGIDCECAWPDFCDSRIRVEQARARDGAEVRQL